MTRIVLLLLSRVDEADGEAVTVVGVVAAATPDPVATQACRAPSATAATRGQFAVTTRSRHGGHDSGGRYGVRERCFSTRCAPVTQQTIVKIDDITYKLLMSTNASIFLISITGIVDIMDSN